MSVKPALILKIFIVICMLCYPILVYVGLAYLDIRIIAMVLFAMMVVRALMMAEHQRFRAWGLVAIGGIVAGLVYLFNDPVYLRVYPVLMSLLMLGIFGASLISPPSVIEVFARFAFKGKEMPEHVIAYTRTVTKVWCVFFVLNGAVAAYTIFQPMEVWTLYNGLISYILMGGLFFCEFVYRHLVVKRRHSGDA